MNSSQRSVIRFCVCILQEVRNSCESPSEVDYINDALVALVCAQTSAFRKSTNSCFSHEKH